MRDLGRDVRYAIRTLAKRPLFAATAITTIALGVGANTAIFSVVHGALLQPLPLHAPDELVTPNAIASTGFGISLSIPNFRDWRERNRSFQSIGANMQRNPTLTGGERPEVLVARWIIGDYFETLGVQPALGRVVLAHETFEGAERLAVVSHRFWVRHLNTDPTRIGSTITLDGDLFTVIGVMPETFVFPSADTDVFLPMGAYQSQLCWDERSCGQGTWAIGRLKPGVTMEMAQADMDRVTREISELEGEQHATARLESLTHAYVGDIQLQIWVLMGAVAFVLLIACANVASLLLARGEGRRKEIALRTALGAKRSRIVSQLLAESLVIALAGGVLGIGIAYGAIGLMEPAVTDNIPSVLQSNIRIAPAVLVFTFAVTLLAGILFGLAPALRGSRSDVHEALKEGSKGTAGVARQRLRSTIVVTEIALSLVLLIGAALMMQSLRQLRDVDRGFTGESVFTAEINLPFSRYNEKEPAWRFYENLQERVEALPGVVAASITNIIPLQGSSWERSIWPEGAPVERETANSVLFHMVTTKHFEILGIPLLQGRRFTKQDREGAPPVAIIDETMAERFWPGEDPIGKRVTLETAEGSTRDNPLRLYRTVIGVTRNVRHYELESPSRIQVYIPQPQSGRSWSFSMSILAKTVGDPLALTELVRREVAALDPDVPLDEINTVEGRVGAAMSDTRVVGALMTVFSVLASVLAGIGIFGVMSYLVAQRVREIGIRMALGARAADVLRMVTKQGMVVTGLGLIIGLGAALGLTRLMSSMLFQVEAVDVTIYAAVAALLLAVAASAVVIPATRAIKVEPSTVLREE